MNRAPEVNTATCAGLVQLFFVKRSFEMFAQRLKLWRPKLEAAGAVVTEVTFTSGWHTRIYMYLLTLNLIVRLCTVLCLSVRAQSWPA